MGHRFTGSRSALLSLCKYPFRDDVEWRDWPRSEESGFGSALHELGELHIVGPVTDPLVIAAKYGVGDVPKLLLYWGHMRAWLDKRTANSTALVELKLALHLEKRYARELKEAGPRNYEGCQPGEIPMSLDLVVRDGDRTVLYDWKTGHSADGYWPQIATNCLALAWWSESAEVVGGILHASERGVDDTRVRLFDRYDLAAIADDLRAALAAVPGARPNAGPHCTELYCGAFGACPETIGAVAGLAHLVPPEKLIPANDTEHTLSLTIQSAEHAAWAIHRLSAYEALAKQVKAAIRAYVGESELPVKAGILKETFRDMPRVSTAELMALARSKGATDEELAACSHISRESAGIRVVRPKGRAA